MAELRASQEEVRSLLGQSNADVFSHLLLASEMVDDLLGASGLSLTRLRMIELYLTCYLYTQGHPQIVRESYENASYQYAMDASGETWLKKAKALDTTGALEELGMKRAYIHVI